MTRRDWLAAAATTATALAQDQRTVRKGRIRQGVTRGCFGRGMSLDDMARHAARLGAVCFDLLPAEDWPVIKKYGLTPNMMPGAGTIRDGINRRENHPLIEAAFLRNLSLAAENGCPTIITLAGSRGGMSDEEGWDNCYTILKKFTPVAEDKGVTICLELLNSKVNHPDYQCDHTKWGVEIVKRVGSPRFKLLYDIYHMQIMEGDVIRTIRDNLQSIGHFHTAGNPGRHEMDDTQELNYRAIAQAILDTGYKGFVTHEYSPTHDPLASLNETLTLFDV